MDRVLKEQIKELRLSGLGYKKIAEITGTTVSTVRYNCKQMNMGGYAAQLPLTYEEPGRNRLYCKQCGEKIERQRHSGKKLFCCEDCRRLWWKENGKGAAKPRRPRYETKCKHCGKVVVYYGSSKRKYCSRDCYVRDRFYKGTTMRPIIRIGDDAVLRRT